MNIGKAHRVSNDSNNSDIFNVLYAIFSVHHKKTPIGEMRWVFTA